MNNVTIRKITNGYIVATNGAPPATGYNECFFATLGEVYIFIGETYEPAPSEQS